jgi:hemerythrin-like metal-binding protein
MERPIEIYQWKQEYQLDVEFLDERHQKFLDLVNLLVQAINEEKEADELPQLFFKLMNFVENYFLQEEMLFKEYQYHDLEKHQEEHNQFVQKIAFFQDEFSKGNESVGYEMLGFLSWWIKDRIMRYDSNALEFLKKHQA